MTHESTFRPSTIDRHRLSSKHGLIDAQQKPEYQPVPWCSGSIADFDRLVFQPLFVGICRSSVRIRQGSSRTTFCAPRKLSLSVRGSLVRGVAGPSGNRNGARSRATKVFCGFLARYQLFGLAIGIYMTSCLISSHRYLDGLPWAALSDTNWKETAGFRTVKLFFSLSQNRSSCLTCLKPFHPAFQVVFVADCIAAKKTVLRMA